MSINYQESHGVEGAERRRRDDQKQVAITAALLDDNVRNDGDTRSSIFPLKQLCHLQTLLITNIVLNNCKKKLDIIATHLNYRQY